MRGIKLTIVLKQKFSVGAMDPLPHTPAGAHDSSSFIKRNHNDRVTKKTTKRTYPPRFRALKRVRQGRQVDHVPRVLALTSERRYKLKIRVRI
jgi:hypothetical protein